METPHPTLPQSTKPQTATQRVGRVSVIISMRFTMCAWGYLGRSGVESLRCQVCSVCFHNHATKTCSLPMNNFLNDNFVGCNTLKNLIPYLLIIFGSCQWCILSPNYLNYTCAPFQQVGVSPGLSSGHLKLFMVHLVLLNWREDQ